MNETYEDRIETNIGCYFWAFSRRCQVTKVSSFSGTFHYGFFTVDEGKFICGWIPVDFIGQCEITA